MNETFFYIHLGDKYNDRLRILFYAEKGKIIDFVVQYESIVNNKWTPIVRYDCSHGFFHRDVLHPDGSREKNAINVSDLNFALAFARQDLEDRWEWYLEQYKKK